MSEQRVSGISWPQFSARDYFDWRRQQLTAHIRALRERQGLSQQALTDWLGCSRTRIAGIENGKGGYALEELEFLALRLEENAGRLTHLSPESETLLQIVFTNEWSHRAPEVIFLWEADTGTLKQWLFLDGWASALAFSPDGRLLAIGTNMDTVKILDCATGCFLTYLDPVEDGYSEALWTYANEVGYGLINQVCFSPDGRYLAAVNEEHGTLRLWETGSWQAVTTWALNPLYDGEGNDEESPFGEFVVANWRPLVAAGIPPDRSHFYGYGRAYGGSA